MFNLTQCRSGKKQVHVSWIAGVRMGKCDNAYVEIVWHLPTLPRIYIVCDV